MNDFNKSGDKWWETPEFLADRARVSKEIGVPEELPEDGTEHAEELADALERGGEIEEKSVKRLVEVLRRYGYIK